MRMKNTILIFIMISVAWSCSKFSINSSTPNSATSGRTKDLVIPNSFNFATSGDISVGILVQNTSTTLSGVPVSIYLDYPGTTESPNLKARKIGTYLSQTDGKINVTLKLPASQDSLYLKTYYIGLESEAGFAITGSAANYKYGQGTSLKSAPLNNNLKDGILYSYMGQFDTRGNPTNYLVNPSDKISQGLLDSINVSLPEGKSLPASHPEYFTTSKSDIVIASKTDIWFTFVSEGTAYLNAVGFYTYNVATPPKSLSDIKTLTIIYPNVSFAGSGGGLISGEKVYLGNFAPGTAIGWFMAPNGWSRDANEGVSGSPTFFSNPALNPETSATKKQHTILFNNPLTGQLILGFEDRNRETQASDEDFNDAVFNITASTPKSISTLQTPLPNIGPLASTPKDSDGDGVADVFDQFPLDPLRAFTSYYPSQDQYTSILAEDLWPSLGDFDFNDMVVDDQFEYVTNAQSNVVEMFINLKVRAIGASFHSGFGIEFPFAPAVVSSVTLTDQSGTVSPVSLEAGQSKAVIIAFNDAFTLLPSMGGGTGVNVIHGVPVSTPKDIQFHILFTNPQPKASMGSAPNNPFVFVNGDRTKEIHMPTQTPTAKANPIFFGQGDDSSNPAAGRYYKSKTNLVWMIEVPVSFSYNIEKNDITKAYLHFADWAQSGGTLFPDWYMIKPTYQDNTLIY